MTNITKYYGIVEGFFGRPLRGWTWEERYKTLAFIKKYAPNINSYFYCPKDDPYVTKKWDYLYPQSDLNKLSKYINYCKKDNIKFIYGFNPQIEEKVDWLEPTIKKMKQLISIGAKNISLVFDDIPLAYDVIENNLTEYTYTNYIEGINKIYNKFQDRLNEFWICAPDYFFNQKTPLTRSLRKLNKNIGIIWSGPDIFVQNIYQKDISKLENVLGINRKIILWFNYPVNDCEQNINTFNLGGFPKINSTSSNKLSGIFANPMRECYANLPFYITFSDYVFNSKSYNRLKSWENALKTLLTKNKFITYKNIINSFSSPNKLDIKSKATILPKKQTLEVNNSLYGKLFLDSIKNIFIDYKNFLQILNRIKKGLKIPLNLFTTFDWFPTITNIARYLPEILEIIKSRYELYESYIDNRIPFIKLEKTVYKFKSKYYGRKKLRISNEDNKKYLMEINNYISLERINFLKLINLNKISNYKKIDLIFKRRQINRFSIT